METIEETLANNLREWREQRGHSQEQLADLAKVSTQTVQSIETMKRWPSPETLRAVSKSLDLPSETILFSRAYERVPPTPEEAIEVLAEFVAARKREPDLSRLGREFLVRLAAANENEIRDIQRLFAAHDEVKRGLDSELSQPKGKHAKKA